MLYVSDHCASDCGCDADAGPWGVRMPNRAVGSYCQTSNRNQSLLRPSVMDSTMRLIEGAMQMQGNVGKRPANMWGAVPQHHHAAPPAQAQHSQAQHSYAQHSRAQHSHAQHSQAQAQQFAFAQAAAHAQGMRHAEGVTPPPPPPNPQMGAFGHAR